ncbi:MAG: YIP1 family protein [Ktedonobacteraceae bacterium]|nr:YIP1 family protein [Ktedonobacteraceae bacterium]
MSQGPNQEQPYTDYSSNPQNPYGYTEQNPYGQNSADTPSQQNSYDSPSSYSSSPPLTDQPRYSYGPAGSPPTDQPSYTAPQPPPLPLSEAIRQLPRQYVKVLTKPSAATFAEEMGKAGWGIIWVQLIAYSIIMAILSFLRLLTNPGLFYPFTDTTAPSTPLAVQVLTIGSIGGLVKLFIVLIAFFFIMGTYYLIAKVFGGQGTFKAQSYTQLLFQVPLAIVIGILLLVPFIAIFSVFLLIYGIVLEIFSFMAVHRLSGGKATTVVLMPLAPLVLLILFYLIAIALVAII